MSDKDEQIQPEQLDSITIAEYYTRGDKQKAELMAAGEYKDLFVLKIKASSTTLISAFILFVNSFFNELIDAYGIVSKSYAVEDIDLKWDWQKYEESILLLYEAEENDSISYYELSKVIKDSFTIPFVREIESHLSRQDLRGIEKMFKEEIFDKYGLINSAVTVASEQISSIDMELLSKSSIKIADKIPLKKSDESEDKEEDFEFTSVDEKEKLELDQKDIKLIIDGELLLSPIKGMHISGLVVGDTINIRFKTITPKTIEIARAFNAYKNQKMLAVSGIIRSFRHLPGGGYKIFVEIAEGVFVKVEEEEENIKVDFVSASPDRPAELQQGIAGYVDKIVDQNRKKQSPLSQKKKKKTSIEQANTNPFVMYIVVIIIIVITFAFLIIRLLK